MKVSLRPLREEDAHTSIRWRQAPEVWTYTLAAGRSPPRLEDELAWIRKAIADPTGRRYALLADGAYIGNVYLTGIADRRAEFHIFIGERDYWGRGIAREATRLALAIAWDELGLDQVHLIVHPENSAARRIYDDLGFSEDGFDGRFVQMSLRRPPHAN